MSIVRPLIGKITLLLPLMLAILLPDKIYAEESSILEGATVSGVFHRYIGDYLVDGNFKSHAMSNNSGRIIHDFLIKLTAS